jgi:hypothetical protein
MQATDRQNPMLFVYLEGPGFWINHLHGILVM